MNLIGKPTRLWLSFGGEIQILQGKVVCLEFQCLKLNMAESRCSPLKGNWKKPNKSIKLVVKKRVNHPIDKSSTVLKTRSLNAAEVTREQLKRRNPFGCSPNKKANISSPHENQENVKLFQDLDKPKSSSYAEHILKNTVEETREFIPDNDGNGQIEEIDKPSSTKEVKRKCLSSENLPLDWSLKTRVRFTSNQPFNWCSKMLGSQEAEGICNFVQCQENNQVPSTLFQQNIMYWIHPCLPWLSLFPRLSSEIKSTSKLPSLTENDDITEALQANWCQSFRSLFNLLRCGYCNYFYLCSAQSTMLFRAANIGGLPSTSVFITPTTKGMRDALDKEGNFL